jgi:hypothetical protein
VTPVLAQGAEVAREALPAGPATFAISALPEFIGPCTLHWRVRDAHDRNLLEKQESAALPLAGERRIALPALPAGLYLLDLWVKVDGRVAGWGSSAFRVRPAGVLQQVLVDRPHFKKGEGITGEVRLTAALPANHRAEVDITDWRGRLVAQAPVTVKQDSWRFSLAIPEPLGSYFTVTARVRDAAGPVEECTTSFGIANPQFGNFMAFQWGSPTESPLDRYALREMQKTAGINGFFDIVLYDTKPESVRPVALAGAKLGLQPVPYAATYIMPESLYDKTDFGGLALKTKGIHEWYKCLSTEAEREKVRTALASIASSYAGCSVVGYSYNEEGGVPHGDSCFCDACLQGFRVYAQQKYGDLATANTAWGTNYPRWEEARGATFAEAEQSGRAERWLDQRLFMMEGYNNWQRACTEGIKSIDQDARVGPECVVNVDRSFDFPKMAPTWGIWGQAIDIMDAVRRSFMPPGALQASWSGNLPMEEDYHRYWPWHAILQGNTHIYWYPAFRSHGLGGIAALYPDFRPFACYQQTGEEVKAIQQGVGPLMLQGNMVLSPVAVHWSTLSYFMDEFHHPETRWLSALRDAYHAVADSGFVYTYIGTPQIEAGDLQKIKVLVLPYSQVLTTKEAEAIRAFVRNGGLLFADFMPGIFDGNGTRLAKSSLADLFGDGTPLRVNTYGKGHAVLMGDALKGYTGRRGSGDAGDRRGMLRMIEQYAGVQPWCRVEDTHGLDRGDIETTIFRHGETYLVGLLRDPGVRAEIATAGGQWTVQRSGTAGGSLASAETTITLPKAFHVYDARRQDYLGYTDTIQTGLVKARAKVFACLPCKLSDITATIANSQPKPGEQLKVTVRVTPDAAKACGLGIRLTVTDAQGRLIEAYDKHQVMTGGMLTMTIPLALDEPDGKYTVTVQEVISGLQRTMTYQVKR